MRANKNSKSSKQKTILGIKAHSSQPKIPKLKGLFKKPKTIDFRSRKTLVYNSKKFLVEYLKKNEKKLFSKKYNFKEENIKVISDEFDPKESEFLILFDLIGADTLFIIRIRVYYTGFVDIKSVKQLLAIKENEVEKENPNFIELI